MEALPLLIERPPLAGDGRLSPDGKWRIHTSRETGEDQICLACFPGVDRRWQLSRGSGALARRGRFGDRILYGSHTGLTAVHSALRGDGPNPGAPQGLFRRESASPVYTGWEGLYEPGPDGNRVLISRGKSERGIAPLTIVLHSTSGLDHESTGPGSQDRLPCRSPPRGSLPSGCLPLFRPIGTAADARIQGLNGARDGDGTGRRNPRSSPLKGRNGTFEVRRSAGGSVKGRDRGAWVRGRFPVAFLQEVYNAPTSTFHFRSRDTNHKVLI
jgi:hypothetical protein